MIFYYSAHKTKLHQKYGVSDNLILDQGWLFDGTSYHKKIEHNQIQIDPTTPFLKYQTKDIPFYANKDAVSTFPFPGLDLVPYDHTVTLNNGNINVIYDKAKNIDHKQQEISPNDYVDMIIETIASCFEKQKTYVIGHSAGLDSTSIRAVMDAHGIKYETIYYDSLTPHDIDPVYHMLQNTQWGFRQVPHYEERINYVTGMYGDEYCMRNPQYVQWNFNARNIQIDLMEIFDSNHGCYMYDFYKANYEKKLQKKITNENYLQQILNDNQVWPVNRMNIICPYKNVDILLTGLNLEPEAVIQQILHGGIQREIISRTNKKLLDTLDQKKNQSDPSFYFNNSINYDFINKLIV